MAPPWLPWAFITVCCYVTSAISIESRIKTAHQSQAALQQEPFCIDKNFEFGHWEPDTEYSALLDSGERDSLEFAQEQCPTNCEDRDARQIFIPKDCHFERFSVSRFANFIRGRSLMFVGDSLTLHWFESMQCAFKVAMPSMECDTNERIPEHVVSRLRASGKHQVALDWYLEQKHNWAWTDCELPDGGRFSLRRLNFLPGFWPQGPTASQVMEMFFDELGSMDYAVVNFGPWYGKSAYQGSEMLNLLSTAELSDTPANTSVNLLNKQGKTPNDYGPELMGLFEGYNANKAKWPRLFWRETAAAHFAQGYFSPDKLGEECIGGDQQQWEAIYWKDHYPVRQMAERFGIWVLSIFMPSTHMVSEHPPLDFEHPPQERRPGFDCRHFCKRSSALRLWTHTLFNAFLQMEHQNMMANQDIQRNKE